MKDNQIIPFSFKGVEVRSVKGDNDEPLFVARDVCDCLGLDNITWALDGIDNEDLTLVKLNSGGQKREMKVVNEAGLYQLIFKSKKEEAHSFKKWVTKEVLPSIRKTGGYVDFDRLEEFMSVTIKKLAHGLSLKQNKRRPGSPLSAEEKELIVTLYGELYSTNAISREIGCDRGTVGRFLEQEREERGVA